MCKTFRVVGGRVDDWWSSSIIITPTILFFLVEKETGITEGDATTVLSTAK